MFNHLSPIRILHVEDEVGDLELTRLFLKRMGGEDFKIAAALSAEAGLNEVEKRRFDVIVSDYMMPGMDGIAFLEALRRRGNDTPFIIFTGKGKEEVAMEALNRGADKYVMKGAVPAIQCAELASSIREVVMKKKMEELMEEVKERYNKGLVEGLVELPWEMDVSSARFTYCGPQIKEMLGYDPGEILSCNHSLFDLLLPKSKLKEAKKIRTLLENLSREPKPKPIKNISMKVLHKDGSVKRIETSIAPIFSKSGKLVGFRGLACDISKRKRDKKWYLRS